MQSAQHETGKRFEELRMPEPIKSSAVVERLIGARLDAAVPNAQGAKNREYGFPLSQLPLLINSLFLLLPPLN